MKDAVHALRGFSTAMSKFGAATERSAREIAIASSNLHDALNWWASMRVLRGMR